MATLGNALVNKILGHTQAEKAFRPWWDNFEDFLVYGLVMLGMFGWGETRPQRAFLVLGLRENGAETAVGKYFGFKSCILYRSTSLSEPFYSCICMIVSCMFDRWVAVL